MPRHETAWCTFHVIGGQWVGKTPPRPSQTLQLAPRANEHDGVTEDIVGHGHIDADES